MCSISPSLLYGSLDGLDWASFILIVRQWNVLNTICLPDTQTKVQMRDVEFNSIYICDCLFVFCFVFFFACGRYLLRKAQLSFDALLSSPKSWPIFDAAQNRRLPRAWKPRWGAPLRPRAGRVQLRPAASATAHGSRGCRQAGGFPRLAAAGDQPKSASRLATPHTSLLTCPVDSRAKGGAAARAWGRVSFAEASVAHRCR